MTNRPDKTNSDSSQGRPDTVATPEGDNEFAPDQPLVPLDHGQQRVPSIDTNKV